MIYVHINHLNPYVWTQNLDDFFRSFKPQKRPGPSNDQPRQAPYLSTPDLAAQQERRMVMEFAGLSTEFFLKKNRSKHQNHRVDECVFYGSSLSETICFL